MIANIIGIGRKNISYPGYWVLQDIFDVLWWQSAPVGDKLLDYSGNGNDIIITGCDFSTNYIPATSSATFKMPDVAGLKTDDEDLLWYTDAGVQEAVTIDRLVGFDYARTIIFYANESPYHIYAIGLLKSSVTLTQDQINKLSESFQLWFLWSGDGIPNDYGYGKDNRTPDPPLPVVSTATVEDANKDKIVITFDLDLDEESIPVVSRFTPSGGKTVTNVAISGAVVTLTVDSEYAYGDTITVSYAIPDGNYLQSLVGGKVASFTNQAVTNNIAPSVPATLADTSKTTAWYIAEETSTITKDGSNRVSRWNDYNATGNDLICSDSDPYKPVWSADGINCNVQYMQGTFTLAQPEFMYVVMKVNAWASSKVYFDGKTTTRGQLRAGTGTPALDVWASGGSSSGDNTNLAVNTFGIIRILLNGASSKFQINATAALTGNWGTAAMDGFTLGASGNLGVFCNGQYKEIIIRKVADSSGDETDIYNYLKTKYSL